MNSNDDNKQDKISKPVKSKHGPRNRKPTKNKAKEKPVANLDVEAVKNSKVLARWAIPGNGVLEPGTPKLTVDQIERLFQARDELGHLEGENQIEVGLVGYVARESLDKLELADREGDAVFADGETHVPLWHVANPPSRATIPVFIMPGGWSVVGDDQALTGLTPSTSTSEQDEFDRPPASRSFSEELAAREQIEDQLKADLQDLQRRLEQADADNQKLSQRQSNVSWFTRLKVKLQNRWAPKAELTLDEARSQPFYLLNSAETSDYRLKGELLIPFKGPRGSENVCKLHHTWLPLPVTDFQRTWMLTDPEFERAVLEGLVKITSEGWARRLLNLEGAVAELAWLDAIEEQVLTMGRPRTIADSNVEIYLPDLSLRDEDA